MLWTAVGLLFVPAVLIKILTRRGRRQVWWTCGTIAPATSGAAAAILGNEHQVGQSLNTPNIAVLLAGLCSVIGCACCFIFWYAVQTEKPEQSILQKHAGVASTVGTGMVVIWLLAPVHDYAYPSFREVPMSWHIVAYAILYIAYCISSQLYAMRTAFQLLRSPQDHDPGLLDPAIRVAIVLNLPGAALSIVGQALYLVKLLFQPVAPATTAGLVIASDLVILGSLGIYALAGLIALAGPRLVAEVRNRRLVASLEPLWRRLRTLYPTIVLPDDQPSKRPDLRAGRMLIEIGDGLALLRVAPGHHNPVDAVAHALIRSDHLSSHKPAAQALPTPTTTREEAQLFLAVSDAYVRLGASAETSSERRNYSGARL